MPLLPRGSSLAGSARAEFAQGEFGQLIANYGYDVRWSKFMVCPNVLPDAPEHHYPDCGVCDNTGRVFYEPKLTRMFASSFALKPQYQAEGRYDHGTVYFTTLPGFDVSYRDRIEMLTARIRYSERIILSPGQLRYRLRFAPLRIQALITEAGTPVPLSSVACDDNGLVLQALPAGANFLSVAYDHHPIYTVVDVMHIVRDSRTTQQSADTPTEFNRQVVAQLEFTRDTQDPNAADIT